MESKYLVFKEIAMPPSRKTKVFKVLNKTHGYELGLIKWYAPWRQYCFVTYNIGSEEVYSWRCMLDIVAFCKTLMEERKLKKHEPEMTEIIQHINTLHEYATKGQRNYETSRD